MKLNFKEAFTFMFKDELFWKKYTIGTLLGMLPVIISVFYFKQILYVNSVDPENIPVTEILKLITFGMGIFITSFIAMFNWGYFIESAKTKILTNTNSLPEWKGNLGTFFLNGIKTWGGMIVLSSAGTMIIQVCTLIFALIFTIVGVIPAVFGATLKDIPYLIFVLILILLFLAIFITLFIVFYLYVFVSYISFLIDTKFLSFFNFKRVKSLIKNNIFNLFLIILLSALICIANIILFFICPILWCIINILLQFYIGLMFNNLFAQYAQIGIEKNNQRLEEQNK